MSNSGGRTLVVGQSGGATAVINASLVGVVEGALRSGAFDRVLGMRHAIEGLLKRDLVDLSTVSTTVLSGLRTTPSAALGTGRYKLKDEELEGALDALDGVDAGALIYIGGNDSADTAHRLHEQARASGRDVRVLSVPKTIDNDLVGTDHCPGYPSYARYLANAVRDATYDSLASPQLYPVKFVEVMGRDAGWVAASTAVGFGPDEQDLLPLLYLPEHPPASAESILADIEAEIDARDFAIAVIPETLRDASGRHLGGDEPEYVDAFGHPYHASTGAALARLVTQRLGRRARYERPGTAARMSISLASAIDLDEAYALGQAAAVAAASGASDLMTSLEREADDPYAYRVTTVPLATVANQIRRLPEEFVPTDRRTATPMFDAYLRPLLGSDPFPRYARI